MESEYQKTKENRDKAQPGGAGEGEQKSTAQRQPVEEEQPAAKQRARPQRGTLGDGQRQNHQSAIGIGIDQHSGQAAALITAPRQYSSCQESYKEEGKPDGVLNRNAQNEPAPQATNPVPAPAYRSHQAVSQEQK